MSGYCFTPWGKTPDTDFCTLSVWVAENRWTALFIESFKNGIKTAANVVSYMDAPVEKILLDEFRYCGPRRKMFVFVSRVPFVLYGQRISSRGDFHAGSNLILARQIHKGELGQKPQIITGMPEVITTFRSQQDYFVEHHRHLPRPQEMKWVNLAEICHITELSAKELLEGYLPFAERFAHEYPAPRFLVHKDARVLAGREVGRPTVHCSIITKNDKAMSDTDPERIWISVQWASNILRLHDLGYKPGMFEQAAQVA